MSKYHYTYLITNLKPSSDKKYYIGVRSCHCVPMMDVNYTGTSVPLEKDILNDGIENFEKIIIAEFSSRDAASAHENQLHLGHSAAKNPLFYNKKNGIIGFRATPESTLLQKETINNPIWKELIGKDQIKKHKETINSTAWKKSKGNDALRKQIETVNNPIWKATKGKEKVRKMLKTQSSTTWQETIGKEKHHKISAIQHDSDWIQANTFFCKWCHREIRNRGCFNRWHNDNCRSK